MYKVLPGDTLELIAKKKYGSEIYANNIFRSNPGISNDLIPGTFLIIPKLSGLESVLNNIVSSDQINDVQIFIDGSRFEFWESINISRSIDSIDTISFNSSYSPEFIGYKELFIPFSYKDILVYIGGELLLTGTIVSNVPKISEGENTINVTGYSLPGVLHDSTPPSSAFSLQFIDRGLIDITKELIKPFGLNLISETEDGDKFDNIAIKPGMKIFNFLTNLAKKRNVIFSNTEKGDLKIWKSNNEQIAVSNLQVGQPPLSSITPKFNEREYYSHITGIAFAHTGDEGSKYTVKNERLFGILRPFTFSDTDTSKINIETATRAKMGRMFGNMASYELNVATWRDQNGNLWEPNTFVQVYAPEVRIDSNYNFIIRSVQFFKEENKEYAILNIVMPGAFSGEIPERLPWDT